MGSKKKIAASVVVFYVTQMVISLCILGFASYDHEVGISSLSQRSLLNNACEKPCNHGQCRTVQGISTCSCDKPYLNHNGENCIYKGKSKLVAFLLSIFCGGLGVDWFYLSKGDGGYIVAGIFKIFTCGGCCVWWMVDWIRILADSFPDGAGNNLFSDM